LHSPLPGMAAIDQHGGQLLPASGYARTSDPVVSRALAENRPTGMAIEVFQSWKGPVFWFRPHAGFEDNRTMYPNVNDVQHTFGVSWGELVELEPQLEILLRRVRLTGARSRTGTDADQVFGPLRNELAALVGFAGKHHSHPVLGSAGAYEVAYWTLYDAVARLFSDRAANAQEIPAKQRAGRVPSSCLSESVSA